MKLNVKPLHDFVEATRNPKHHNIPALQASLRRFGFIAPVIEDGNTGRLVAGHGRLAALVKMKDGGESPPARVEVRKSDGAWLVPVLAGVTFDSAASAEAYLLADNHLVESGGWDTKGLAAILAADGFNTYLPTTGWSDEEALKIIASAMDRVAPVAFTSVDEGAKETIHCPRCGFPVPVP